MIFDGDFNDTLDAVFWMILPLVTHLVIRLYQMETFVNMKHFL